ncbi:MAG: winged helix-turn-helix domain-containing protein [Rikenellaceae bacterium]|nr:winged helix-turn-helix domain-containing protein [Rikenellaceae bacterium]
MSKESIGIHAGMVWTVLNDGDKWDFTDLKRKTSLKNNELCAALEWLAREDKIALEETNDGLLVYLKDLYLHFKFYF